MTEWVTVATAEAVPEGVMIGVQAGAHEVLVANVRGEYRAIGNVCTHAGCMLEQGELDADEGVVTCVCHGSVFDLSSGEVVSPPADEGEPVYQVRLEGDELQVAKPEE